MTTFEQNVKAICDEVSRKFPKQILIDFIQDEVEEIFEKPPSRDEVGALSYDCSCMLEVYNPALAYDIDILTRLMKALNDWCTDIEQTNVLLGIPKES